MESETWRRTKMLLGVKLKVKYRQGELFKEILFPLAFYIGLILVWLAYGISSEEDTSYINSEYYSQIGTSNITGHSPSLVSLVEWDVQFKRSFAIIGESDVATDYGEWLKKKCPSLESVLIYFENDSELNAYINDNDYGKLSDGYDYGTGYIGQSVQWIQADVAPYEYKIRLNATSPGYYDADGPKSIVDTNNPVERLQPGLHGGYIFDYTASGFSTLQLMTDAYIFEKASGALIAYSPSATLSSNSTQNHVLFEISTAPFPVAEYDSTEYWDTFGQSVMDLLNIVYFLYPISALLADLVMEKESKIREGMQMMGLEDSSYYGSYFLWGFGQFTLITTLISVFTSGTLYRQSDFSLVWLHFTFFGWSAVAMVLMLSTFFSRAKAANTLGPLIIFVLGAPVLFYDSDTSTDTFIGTAFFSPCAFVVGCQVFADFEDAMIGLTADNVDEKGWTFLIDEYSLLIIMAVDTVIYLMLAWYFDKVLPSEYGTQLPWNFPFTREYWQGETHGRTDEKQPLLRDSSGNEDPNFEPVSASLTEQIAANKGVSIRKLRKVFKTTGEDRVAVDCLDLDMYEGQVLALLGHNGAGKSTTITMLTGLFSPSSGDAQVYGLSISNKMREIRKMLGVCPQHDILFEDLTVREHLEAFAIIKNVPEDLVVANANEIIEDVGLGEFADVRASELSGGLKRKLSVGIAFVGGSKVVVLDEPTSGMDIHTRHDTWKLIRRMTSGRIILHTTHAMDEADYLGDRIAILSQGVLITCGSGLFLKNRFGDGYTLTIAKASPTEDPSKATELLKRHIPAAVVISSVGGEIIFRLPTESIQEFPAVFSELDKLTDKGSNSGYIGYAISVTSLEEVFLRIAHESGAPGGSQELMNPEGEHKKETTTINVNTNYLQEEEEDFEKKMARMGHQLQILVLKRIRLFHRDVNSLMYLMVIPMAALLIGICIANIVVDDSSPQDYTLNPGEMDFNSRTCDDSSCTPLPFNLTDPTGKAVSAYVSEETVMEAVDVDYRFEDEAYEDAVVAAGTCKGPKMMAMQENLLDDSQETKQSKYGSAQFFSSCYNSSDFSRIYSYGVQSNTSQQHALGVHMNIINSAILNDLADYDGKAAIITHNHPLPYTDFEKAMIVAKGDNATTILYCIGMIFSTSVYIMLTMREKQVGAKVQQLISGANPVMYWLSFWITDVLMATITSCCILAMMAMNISEEYLGGDRAAVTALVLFIFPFAMTAFSYYMSFKYETASAAQMGILSINFCSFVFGQVYRIGTRDKGHVVPLDLLLCLSPLYALVRGLGNISECYDTDLSDGCEDAHLWRMTKAGGQMVMLCFDAVLYFSLVLYNEYHIPIQMWLNGGKKVENVTEKNELKLPLDFGDDSVKKEMLDVNGMKPDEQAMVIREVSKVYLSAAPEKETHTQAATRICLSAKVGECVGVLGISGAGKTTLLSMCAGDLKPSAGSIHLMGHDVAISQGALAKILGYCPQENAIFEDLTVQEHLEIYAGIKGLKGHLLDAEVQSKIKQLSLDIYANKAAGSLSGGNKRKLSVAMALISDPPVVIMDEPSTGVDPAARRFLWNVVSEISSVEKKSAVLLSSCYTDEAESVSSRIGILLDGKLQAVASSQELKNVYGGNLFVDLKYQVPTMREVQDVAFKTMAKMSSDTKMQQFIHQSQNSSDKVESMISPSGIQMICDTYLASFISYPSASGLGLYEKMQATSESENLQPVVFKVLVSDWMEYIRECRVRDFIFNSFSGASLVESRGRLMRYKLTLGTKTGDVFKQVEGNKEDYNISEYSVGFTTLENIFMEMMADADRKKEAAKG